MVFMERKYPLAVRTCPPLRPSLTLKKYPFGRQPWGGTVPAMTRTWTPPNFVPCFPLPPFPCPVSYHHTYSTHSIRRCTAPFTLAGTSRQRRTRADAITAFYRRSRGGWVNGKEAVPTIWAEGPCFPKISAVVAFILADCRLSSREQVDSGGWGSTGGGSVASKRHVVTKMVPPTVAVTYTSAAMHHERAVASVEACA